MGPTVRVTPAITRIERSAEWARLLQRQAGAVGRAQLLRMGVDKAAVDAQIEGARWQHPVHGVYVTHTGPLTAEVIAVLRRRGWTGTPSPCSRCAGQGS
jgi:hypothetical protein